MEPRVSLISLGTRDIARAIRFYRDGLGWPVSSASVEGNVAFIAAGPVVLSIYGRASLAAEAGLPDREDGTFGGISLAHNVATREEVDVILQEVEAAGGTILQPGRPADWGGYIGHFADPDGHPWEVAWNPYFPLREDGTIQLP